MNHCGSSFFVLRIFLLLQLLMVAAGAEGHLGQLLTSLTTTLNNGGQFQVLLPDLEFVLTKDEHPLEYLLDALNNGLCQNGKSWQKVPKLDKYLAKLEEIAGKFNLQVRGTTGEHIYDMSKKRSRLSLTEYQAVREMYDGIAELIKIEKSL